MIAAIARNRVKTHSNRRGLWGWLTAISNKFDQSRVDEVGTEVAAAEWLIRNGASVKWTKYDYWEKDYNSLPKNNPGSAYAIEEIDATESSIMSLGFPHLKGLKHLKKFVVKRNYYFDDQSLAMLSLVKDTLRHLEVISCGNITEDGVLSLTQLQALRTLKLFDLTNVDDKERCLERLKSSLTKCDIEWK